MKTEEEVQKMADTAQDASKGPTKFKGMTYEEGVRNALDWVLGEYEDDDGDSPL